MSREHVQVQILFEDIVYHIFFDIVDLKFAKFDTLEEGKKINIGKGYYCFKHPSIYLLGNPHYEIYRKKNKLFAVNVDGSSHDGSSGIRIPNVVYNFLIDVGIPLEKDQIIELINFDDFYKLEQFIEFKLLKEAYSQPRIADNTVFVELFKE